MALIHCPECGKEVSDQSKKCIYCGASIFVCPECGKISVSEGRCPRCGYSAVSQKTVIANNTPEMGDAGHAPKNVYERWKESDPRVKSREKIFSVVSIGLWVMEFILAGIWFFLVLIQYKDLNLEKLVTLAVNHESNLQKTNIFFSIIMILVIISSVVDTLKGIINYYSCANWIRRSRVRIKDDISAIVAVNNAISEKKKNKKIKGQENYEEDMTETEEETNEGAPTEELEAALFLAVDPNKGAFFAALKSIPQLIICALKIFVYICLRIDAVSYMSGVLHGNFVDNGKGALVFKYEYSFDWLTLVIGVAIALVLALAAYLICEVILEKKMDKTLQKVYDAKLK